MVVGESKTTLAGEVVVEERGDGSTQSSRNPRRAW